MAAEEANGEETPAVFLEALGQSLSAKAGADGELTAILCEHILKITPAKEAVAAARTAIAKLAATRAAPAKPDPADG